MYKVLIVDDSRNIRALLSTTLSVSGFAPVQAESGTIALQMYSSVNPAAVLLDMVIPGDLDGIAILRKIKEIDPGAKVIMLTGLRDSTLMKKASDAGAKGFLHKPYNPLEIINLLHEMLPTPTN